MAAPDGIRPAAEIRDHFLARLNAALLRPGMYGGELALRQFLEDLAWIDRRQAPEGGVAAVLADSGAWSPVGVRGVFQRMFGGSAAGHDAAAALVYADLAARWGYLAPERTLTPQEYTGLRRDARAWIANTNRIAADVIGAFGPPSLWRPRYNPWYPMSFAYAPAGPADPLVVFDFWQDTDWQARPRQSRFGPEPVLRNVRWLAGRFEDGFTFTPIGRTLLTRPASSAVRQAGHPKPP